MSVSILIPTYNRKHFEELINLNIKIQTYPLIKEIIIADDGEEQINFNIPYSVLYYKVDRMSIGEKRNFLKSKASGDYLIHFDTDDFYHKDYISNSVFNLIQSGKSLSGSSDMLMYDGKNTYKQHCIYLNFLNEATLCYTKEYSKNNDFKIGMSSEGLSFCKIKDISELDINHIMICLCHSSNTVDKKPWTGLKYLSKIDMDIYKKHLELNLLL
jgi:glycosyltransferase involved in cell wall biosynthesis